MGISYSNPSIDRNARNLEMWSIIYNILQERFYLFGVAMLKDRGCLSPFYFTVCIYPCFAKRTIFWNTRRSCNNGNSMGFPKKVGRMRKTLGKYGKVISDVMGQTTSIYRCNQGIAENGGIDQPQIMAMLMKWWDRVSQDFRVHYFQKRQINDEFSELLLSLMALASTHPLIGVPAATCILTGADIWCAEMMLNLVERQSSFLPTVNS